MIRATITCLALLAVAAACSLAAGVQVTPFVVTTATANQRAPVISGPLVAYEDERTSGQSVNLYVTNLDSHVETPYATGAGDQWLASIFGTALAWMDSRPGVPSSPNHDIFYSPLPGLQFNLTTDGLDQWWPSVTRGLVTWEEENAETGWDIAAYYPATGTRGYISQAGADEYESSAAYPWVVWKEYASAGSLFDLVAKNLVTGEMLSVCAEPQDQQFALTDGRYVVWEDYRDSSVQGSDIYLFDLGSRSTRPICVRLGAQWAPAVSGNFVVWQDNRNGNWDIFGFDLTTGQEFPVCTESGEQSFPRIDGNRVVWQDKRSGNFDIYGATISRDWTSSPSIAQAKMQPDGTAVELSGRVVTADFGPVIYITDPDRNSGIKVSGYWDKAPGTLVTVRGVMATEGRERVLMADQVLGTGSVSPIRPINIGSRFLGGKGFHPLVPDLMNSLHLHNAGLLVKLSGAVTSAGAGWIYVDDGSNLDDEGKLGVRISTTWTAEQQAAPGDVVSVIGICAPVGTEGRVEILTRSASDIELLVP